MLDTLSSGPTWKYNSDSYSSFYYNALLLCLLQSSYYACIEYNITNVFSTGTAVILFLLVKTNYRLLQGLVNSIFYTMELLLTLEEGKRSACLEWLHATNIQMEKKFKT